MLWGRITTSSSVSERQEARLGGARFIDSLYTLYEWLCRKAGLPPAPQSRRGRKRDKGRARLTDSLYTLSERLCCGAGLPRLLSLGEAGSEIRVEHVLRIHFIPYLSGCVVGQDYYRLLSLGEAGSQGGGEAGQQQPGQPLYPVLAPHLHILDTLGHYERQCCGSA